MVVIALRRAVVAAALGVAVVAHADPTACRRAIARAAARHAQSVMLVLQRCEDRRVSGRFALATDCARELGTTTGMARADAKLRRAVARRCGGPDHRCGTADDEDLDAIGWSIGACP